MRGRDTQYLGQRVTNPHFGGTRSAPSGRPTIRRSCRLQNLCEELRDFLVDGIHVVAEPSSKIEGLDGQTAAPGFSFTAETCLLAEMHGEGVAEVLGFGFGVPPRVVQVDEVGLSLALRVLVVELVEGAPGVRVQLVHPPLTSAKVVEERSG